ncbi:MAG: ImmA/IrrE family metallo-endopeptidase [Lentisphaeria bacterium]|nr:ImmA/IrrE family metallo-endopeptidase [Lentisphaeria bacterium]
METNFRVAPMSRRNLRQIACAIRKRLHITTRRFPIVSLLDPLTLLDKRFNYSIECDENFPTDVHAYWDPFEYVMHIRESVYLGACDGRGRDRMTLAHEFAHYILHTAQTPSMARTMSSSLIRPFESAEWQATTFAAELLMPADSISGDESVAFIAEEYGVSEIAASVQLGILKKERRKI